MVWHNFTQLSSLLFGFPLAKVLDNTWHLFWNHLSRGSKWTETMLEGEVKTLQTTDWPERIVTYITWDILHNPTILKSQATIVNDHIMLMSLTKTMTKNDSDLLFTTKPRRRWANRNLQLEKLQRNACFVYRCDRSKILVLNYHTLKMQDISPNCVSCPGFSNLHYQNLPEAAKHVCLLIKVTQPIKSTPAYQHYKFGVHS